MLTAAWSRAVALRCRVSSAHGSLAILDQALISGGTFASALVVAREVPQEDFGLFVLAGLAFSVGVMIQGGLVLQPLVVNGAVLDRRSFGRFLRATVPVQLTFTAFSVAAIAVVCLSWEPLRPFLLPISLNAALVQGQEFCRRVLYTRAGVLDAVANDLVGYDLQVLPLAVVAAVSELRLDDALWIVTATSFLAVVLGVAQLRRFWTAESDDVWTVARMNFRIGKWTGASAMVAATSTNAYPAIVAALVDLRSTAGLGVIRQILGPVQLLTRPFESYYLPRATRALSVEGPAGLNRVMWRAAATTAPLHVLYAGILLLAPTLVLGLLYGDRYLDEATALRLFALASALYIPVHVLKLEINARRLQRHLLTMEIWTVALVYGIGLYLIGRFGLVGAALTQLAASVSQLVFFVAVVSVARGRSRPPGASRRAVMDPRRSHGVGRGAAPPLVEALAPPGRDLLEIRKGPHTCWYVPSASAFVRFSSMGLYPAYGGPAIVHHAALRAWVASGAARATHPTVRREGQDWPLADLLGRDLPTLSTAAVTTGVGPDQNATAQLMDARGAVLAFAKYAASPAGEDLLTNEARMLRLIPEGTGPRLLRFTPFLDGCLLVQTPVRGRANVVGSAIPAPHRRLLDRLAVAVGEHRAEDHPFVHALDARAGRHRPLVETVVSRFDATPWPVVCMHGDFWFGNVRLWQGTSRAFDWEHGTDRGFPALDAAHWLLQSSRLVRRAGPATAKQQVVALLRAYLPPPVERFAPVVADLAALAALVAWYPSKRTDENERWLAAFVGVAA